MDLTLYVYAGIFLIGLLMGFSLTFKRFEKKAIELLDFLYMTKTIDKEDYETYKEKWVTTKNTPKNLLTTIKGIKKKKERS